MLINIVSFISLLSYAIIVSQSFMYILALRNTQLALTAPAYIEVRQLIDVNMRSVFKYILYITLVASLALVIVHFKNPGSLAFITAVIALVALIADILLTIKGNLPINDEINDWAPDNYPLSWHELRTKWFRIFGYRQFANILGFVSLVVGVVF